MFDEQGRKIATSKHLEGISDLTVAAPIRDGFVPAFETITYEGRVRLVMKALYRLRSASREYELLKPFADSAERIQSLHSFRLGILPGNPATLVLAATFDRAWEPYMRLIWSPLGPMLDVIFCNCEGYVSASDHSFADYAEWVRRHQVDADFFYASTALSVADLSYLSEAERKMRDLGPDADAELTKLTSVNPVTSARAVRDANKFTTDQLAIDVLRALYRLADYYPYVPSDKLDKHGKYLIRATKGLIGEDWDPTKLKPEFQQRLAKEIAWLQTPVAGVLKPVPSSAVPVPGEVQMGILAPFDSANAPITHGGLMLMQVTDPAKARRFIAGLEVSWEDGTYPDDGIFVNLAFSRRGLEELGVPQEDLDRFPKEFEEGMEARAGLLGDVRDHHPRRWRLPKRWMPETPISYELTDTPVVNVELVSPDEAGSRPAIPLPADPPSDLVEETATTNAARPAAMNVGVDLSEVDLMIQLRIHAPSYEGHEIADHPDHPLYTKVNALVGDPDVTGVRLLAVESMRRTSFDPGHMRDHFGFLDGLSQPIPRDVTLPALQGRSPIPAVDPANPSPDAVAPGELLWGFANDRTDAAPARNPYLDNGSFLVVRKLRQDRKELDDFKKRAEVEMKAQAEAATEVARARPGGENAPAIVAPDGDDVLAYMMGRRVDGKPLVAPDATDLNDFNYDQDATGTKCPLRAHIRRTNPRTGPIDGRKGPRIMRRGLSYGPPYRKDEPDGIDRGLIFMCYNASIAEQYEVIQRWLNGASPTGISSSQNDPLTGVGTPGDPRTFRFEHNGHVWRVKLDRDPPLLPKAAEIVPEAHETAVARFVRLEWGQYLFAPSKSAVALIASGSILPSASDLVERGRRIVARLEQLETDGRISEAALGWKTCLEDFTAREPTLLEDGPAVWAAIRARGGIMRVPYGDWTNQQSNPRTAPQPKRVVLVGGQDLVSEVFTDPRQLYSVAEHGAARMPGCFGRIYIGRNGDDPAYAWESAATNARLMSIPEAKAFDVARKIADKTLEFAFDTFQELLHRRQGKIDLRDQFITPVLAQICRYWFGIPDDLIFEKPADLIGPDFRPVPKPNPFVTGGGWDWQPAATRLPKCPGDYMSLSRYLFIPDPLPALQEYGKEQGQRLLVQITKQFQKMKAENAKPHDDTITSTIWNDPVFNGDPGVIASNVIGIMTGFLPPADGNLRLALHGWLEEKDLWRIQQTLAACPRGSKWERADATLRPALIRAMRERPAPDMVLRTAREDHKLGGFDIRKGEEIYVGIIGATQQNLDDRHDEVGYLVFGGNRRSANPPVHACPAYRFAMGTMLGILSSLLENCRIEALPAPLKALITDPKPPASETAEEATSQAADPAPAPTQPVDGA